MVPRLRSSSSAVMPIPLSEEMVYGCILIKGDTDGQVALVIAITSDPEGSLKLSLSTASLALEISLRRKISYWCKWS